MLHLIQSNKMEVLQQQLIALIKTSGYAKDNLQRILQPDTIIVQSPGMAQWLKIDIANSLNIAANIDFPLPSSYIWNQYQAYFDDLPTTSSFTKDNMTWKLMQVLPGYLSHPAFSQVNDYVKQGSQFTLFQLCQKIADVYDQYQVYRPDWIMSWESGGELADPSFEPSIIDNHQWQVILWRALVEETESLGESTYHRANLHSQLIEKISRDNLEKEPLPLYIFGISALPQQQLQVFEAIGQNRDVFLFWCNPCAQYWGDIVDEKTRVKRRLSAQSQPAEKNPNDGYLDVGNPLLASWGKPGRDYHEMLLMSSAEQHDYFIEYEPQNMLETLQSEVLNLTMRGSHLPLSAEELLGDGEQFPKIIVATDDNSIQIHSCHSKIRELEVLHDFLLHQFEANPQLNPTDIVVMMPDVASYAPYIDGVFGSMTTDMFIPYSISDRNVTQESDVVDSFLQMLSLHQSRLGLTDVLTLLEVPAIAAKFEITLDDYENIRFWLTDSGFRWGWDDEDKQRWLLPETFQNTFLFALERLIAGYAMSGHNLFERIADEDTKNRYSFISPYLDIEGQNALALGKLYEFAKCLHDMMQFCSLQAPLQSKSEAALEFIDRFYLVPEEQQVFLNKLRQGIESIAEHHQQYDAPIEQDIFYSAVKESIQSKGVGQRFLAGTVNFCTLMPMRSIPFSQVCLLGMNDQDYPRQTVPIGFDLVRHSSARRGDRSRRQDDRYLFLEALLSARQQLYISFIGASARDNSDRNPSILVSELTDYCLSVFCLSAPVEDLADSTNDRMLQHIQFSHHLQPFSEPYFRQGGKLSLSFQQHWLSVINQRQLTEIASPFITEALPKPEELGSSNIELNELVAFYVNPARYFFHFRWRTGLQIYHDSLVDEEPFNIDGLLRYHMNQTLVEKATSASFDAAGLESQALAQWQSQGILPIGEIGKLDAKDIFLDNEEFLQRVMDATGEQKKQRAEVDIVLGEFNLQGWVQDIFNHNLILFRPGKLRGQDKLKLWLLWLSYCAMQNSNKSANSGDLQGIFVAKDKSFTLSAVEPKEARSELAKLIQVYQNGLNEPLPFFPNSAATWIETGDLNKAIAVFDGNYMVSGEGQEANIQRMFPQLQEVLDRFDEISQQVVAPMYQWEVKS
ncbi:exodeoxyribonuclease V subunit gamma [Aliiglaciecola sp. M165]|uniref:exodeoxyribonuclease V subunit gamma n=1 Tax=Aliiglaciecola sp. M165 TaxID=2593649 RepID=UPI0011802408|nr:exodeoxyribonuclease V subunit gamma [Aliiglaciecola sp. M165]TRY32586.1 exodeoxyribonuclease V subunit gamma [Aliiglaciecola sp. M165]